MPVVNKEFFLVELPILEYPSSTGAEERMDAIDRKILAVVQEDASLSVAEIGQRVGLSSTPCWKRSTTRKWVLLSPCSSRSKLGTTRRTGSSALLMWLAPCPK